MNTDFKLKESLRQFAHKTSAGIQGLSGKVSKVPQGAATLKTQMQKHSEGLFTAALYKIYIKKMRRRLLLWLFLIGGFLLTVLMLYPTVAASKFNKTVTDMLSEFPAEFTVPLQLQNLPNLNQFLPYFGLCMQLALIAACVYACYLGAAALIRDESSGHIILFYSQPVSRTGIVFTRICACLTEYLLFLFGLFFLSLLAGSIVAPLEIIITAFLKTFAAFFFAGLLFMAAGLVVSGHLVQTTQASGVAFGMFLFSFIAGVLGLAVKSLSWLACLSPYHYYDVLHIADLSYGFPVGKTVLILVLSAVGFFLGLVRYHRRDMQL